MGVKDESPYRISAITMSQDFDSPNRQPDSKLPSKVKDTDTEKGERKRKRKNQDGSQNPSPKKKRRSSQQISEIPVAIVTPITPPILPESSAGSSFHQQTSSLYLPLSPISQSHPLRGLCAEHLSPLILTYYPALHGVILSYANVRLSSSPTITSQDEEVLARSIDEYAATFIWVTAEFLLFRPERGNILEGWVNLQNEGNVGLVCLNFFNASIERKRLPKEWRWVSGGAARSRISDRQKLSDDELSMKAKAEKSLNCGVNDIEGQFVDGSGNPVEGLIRFYVKDIETSRSADRENGFLSIVGTMLSKEDEDKLWKEEVIMAQRTELRRSGQPRESEHAISGALAIGVGEEDRGSERVRKSKSKSKRGAT